MLKFINILAAFLLIITNANGQTIEGLSTVNAGEEEAYYIIVKGDPLKMPTWQVSGGTVTAQTVNSGQLGSTYYVDILWGNGTSGNISFQNGRMVISTKAINIIALPTAPPNPTASTNACGSKTLTRQGTPPSGVTWYWQTSASGTSTSLGSGSTYVVQNSGTYYLRAKNSIGWSPGSGSVAVSVTNPAMPPVATVQMKCNMATISVSAPPSGVTYHWQSSATGTNTDAKLSGTSTFLSQSGYYYVRAKQGDCWSDARSGYVDLSAPQINIHGLPEVSVNNTETYTYTTPALFIAPTWSAPKGVVLSSGYDSNTSTYTATVKWTSEGEGKLRLCSDGHPVGETSVSVFALPDQPSHPRYRDMYPIDFCGPKVLVPFGTAPSGVTWYWQTSPYGTSISHSESEFTVEVDGTYYIRGRNEAGGWGPASAGLVVDLIELPAAPPVPTVSYNCGLATVSRATPPEGITYYWQTDPNGTDVSDSRETHPATAGTYYLRAKSTQCWGGASYVTVTESDPSVRTKVALGQHTTYHVDNTGSSGVWWHANGGTDITNTYAEGTRYYADVEWNKLGEGYLKGCTGQFLILGTFVDVVPPAPMVQVNCDKATLTRVGSVEECETWYWYKTGSNTALGSGQTLTVSTSGTYYLKAKLCDGTWGSSGFSTAVNVVPLPVSPADVSVEDIFNPGFVTMIVNNANPAYTYQWYRNGVMEHEGTTYNAFVAETSTFKVYSVENGCLSATPKSVTSNVLLVPSIQVDGSLFLKNGEQTRLYVSSNVFSYYQWVRDGMDIIGSTQTEINVSTPGTYHLAVSLDGTNYYRTSSVKVVVLTNNPDDSGAPLLDDRAPNATVGTSDINYVRTYAFRVSSNDLGIGPIGTAPDFPVEQVNVSTQYIDGLGRPVQNVVKQGSPQKKDIIQSVEYDGQGRQFREYLPYVSGANLGAYNNNHLLEQYNFYRNQDNTSPTSAAYKVSRTGVPYAETKFEDSPLDKVIEKSAPGETWRMGRGHTIKSDIRPYNAADDQIVINWSVTNDQLVHQGYLYSGELMVQLTIDEHGQEVREFTDKLGRTVLKRVNGNNRGDWLDTYYVYDIFNNLRFVLPPECSAKVIGGFDWATDSGIIDNWAFQYSYDGRKRMISKKVPGAEVVYLVYDNRDRLVLTQDGEQRLTGEWAFTKYDQLNRPILSGVTAISGTLSEIRIAVKNHSAFYEEAGGGIFGYTNNAYPVEADVAKYYTVTYYDDYTFPHASTMTFEPELGHTAPFDRVKGQVTGTVTKVLGESKWLKGVTYYDNKYRVIQSQQENLHDDINIITNRYSFVGEVLETQTTEKDTKVSRSMTYDHAGRLIDTYHSINGNERVTWKDLANMTHQSGEIVKTTGGHNWNAGAASVNQIPLDEDGAITFTAEAGNYHRMIGLSQSNPDVQWQTIKYAFYLKSDKKLHIRESGSGSLLPVESTYQVGDKFKIERKNGLIRYFQNGVLLRSTGAVSAALLVDVSVHTAGYVLEDVFISKDQKVLLSHNEYNEIGELIEKNLHSEDDKASFAQSVDYTYNTRGWLTKINNSQLSETEDISPADYFGMDLMYNYGFDQVQYNGNIAGVKWKTFGDTNTKAYGYVYDGLNRIRYADYVTGNTGSWLTNAGAYNVMIKEYDRNGNILRLNRYADHAGVTEIDQLIYNYGQGTSGHSNQLLKVKDDSSSPFKDEGFKDVSGVDYGYDENGNMKSDANKGITSITYNHLNLPARVTKDANNYIDYIYDAAGTKLAQIVHENGVEKRTDYIGEFIYEREGTDPAELQIVQHEEGRLVPDGNGGFIYQYHLKDHLGNVRLSFTTRQETLEFKATFESENATDEESLYSNIAETRVPFNSADANADGGDEVVRLNGSQPVGPGISLPVGAGDEIDMAVFGYYEGGTGYSSSNTTTALVSAVAGAFGGVNGGTSYEQATYDAFEGAYTAPGGMAINGTANDNRPAAYLNYILFDENMVYYQHGHAQISIAADMNHEKISINDIVAPKAGFVYVYVSNESVAANWVYFDDMNVTIKEHAVIQKDDYYPFGLTFNNGFQRITAKENNIKYNGFELQKGLDWGVYDYQARYYDPILGRFLNIDPAADLMRRHGPYNYAFDNPIRFIDPDGMIPEDQTMCPDGCPKNDSVEPIRQMEQSIKSLWNEVSSQADKVADAIGDFFTFSKIDMKTATPTQKSYTDVDGFASEDPDSTPDDNAPRSKNGPPRVVVEPEAPEVDEFLNRVEGFKGFFNIIKTIPERNGERIVVGAGGDTLTVPVLSNGYYGEGARPSTSPEKDSVKRDNLSLPKTKLTPSIKLNE